jgi:O-antigen/teichoic acid export membrane protein
MRIKVVQVLLRLGKILEGGHARQFLAYGVSVGGTMAAGFLLVLILVRTLPAEAYGGLVLTKALLLVVISLAGMGLSQAAVRWGALKEPEDRVLGSVLGGVSFAVLPATVLLVAFMLVFAERLKLTIDMPLIAATFLLVLSYILNNELVNWWRARHQANRHALLSTVRAIQQMVAITAGVLLMRNAAGYIYGLAAGELLLLAWLGYGYRAQLVFQAKLLGEMLRYGWPHTFVIASGFMLNYADRYMLAFLTNDNSVVAYYDAASMVVVSALAVLVRPFNLFLFPAYTRRYEAEGRDATVMLVNRAQRLFLIAGLGLSTVVVGLRGPLLQLLFPADYSAASSIFAAVAYGTVLNGVFMATVAGLYISKRTVMVSVVAIVTALANLAANWLLIPIYGINGAALSIVISGFVQIILGYYFSHKLLPVKLPIGAMVGGALWLGFVSWVFP